MSSRADFSAMNGSGIVLASMGNKQNDLNNEKSEVDINAGSDLSRYFYFLVHHFVSLPIGLNYILFLFFYSFFFLVLNSYLHPTLATYFTTSSDICIEKFGSLILLDSRTSELMRNVDLLQGNFSNQQAWPNYD